MEHLDNKIRTASVHAGADALVVLHNDLATHQHMPRTVTSPMDRLQSNHDKRCRLPANLYGPMASSSHLAAAILVISPRFSFCQPRLPAPEPALQFAAVGCRSLQDPKGQWETSRPRGLGKDEVRLG